MSPRNDFQRALDSIQSAIRQFCNGDPAAYISYWSHSDPVTICGGWGAYECGWTQVGPRLEWAASRWRGGHTEFKVLAMDAGDNLGYTVWIEHGDALLAGIDEYRPIALRVTHLFRHEDGCWKIVHRHADAITEKIDTAAVLRQ